MIAFTDLKPQADNQAAIKMASASPSPLLKLFGVDRLGPGHSLQHIRDKVYSYAWSRIRRDDHKLDFVISETGINRNVPERLVFGEDPYGAIRAPRMPPPPCNLLLVNKQVSKDFARYIYSVNDLEVDVDLKPLYTDEGQAALGKISTLLCNSNMKRYTRNVRVRIHFPAKYANANLPAFNQSSLSEIALSLDDFQHLEHVAIRMVPGQGAPLDYELRLAVFPFYPMRLTNWSIRMLNTDTFPYAWDLIDTQNVGLLDQAYHIYQQTGSLTAPILPAQFNMSSSEANHKGIRQSAHSLRQPTNGSQKRRVRKKKAIEADFAEIEPTVEAPSSATKQVASTATVSNVRSPGREATMIHPTRTGTEHDTLDLEMVHIHTTAAKSSAEGSPSSNGVASRASFLQQARPTSAPSPPLSPAHENKVPLVPDSIASLISLPTKSSIGKCVNDHVVSHSAEQEIEEPSSPAPSSVTLAPAGDDLAIQLVDHMNGATGDGNGDSAKLQPPKRKRRSKKRKNTKTKSEIVQPVDLLHDNGHGAIAETETEMKMSDQQQSEPSKEVACRLQEAPVESSSPDVNRFDLTRGRWYPVSDSYAVFRPNTGIGSLEARTPRIERYMRQQDRILAARAEVEERQKQAKVKNQARKARKLLLRRDHIAADSPLLRAMERPRDCSKKSIKPRSRSPAQKATETIGKAQEEYCRLAGEEQRIQEQIRKRKRGLRRAVELRDGEKRNAKDQSGPPSPDQDHCIDFETGLSDNENDSDSDSVDLLFRERSESIATEGSGEEEEESRTAIFVAKVDRRMGSGILSLRIKSQDSDSDRFETTSPSTSDEAQYSTENASAVGPERLIEEHSVAQPGSPAFPVSMSPAEQDQIDHEQETETTEPMGLWEGVGCGGSFPRCIAGDEEATGSQVNSSENDLLCDIDSEPGPNQQPVLQPHSVRNDFVRPVSPGSPCMSGALLTQRIVEEDPFKHAQSSAEVSQPDVAQRALENNQRLPKSNEITARMHGHSMMGVDHPGAQYHRRVSEENQRGRWGGQRGRHSRRGRGSNYRTYRGDRTPSMGSRAGTGENAWATAVQESDRELIARRVEQRIELEQHMQATGTTYTDYAGLIEDSYVQLDEHRKPVNKKVEQIVYGPSSDSLLSSDGSVPMSEAATLGPSEMKDSDPRDVGSG